MFLTLIKSFARFLHLKDYENLKRNVKRNTKVQLKREQHLMIYGVWKKKRRKGKFTTAK